MKRTKLFFLFLTAFSTFHLPGAWAQPVEYFFGKRHSLEIGGNFFFSAAAETTNFSTVPEGAFVEARAFPGLGLSLHYRFAFHPRWWVEAGGGRGVYFFAWRVSASAGFLGKSRGLEATTLVLNDGAHAFGRLGVFRSFPIGQEGLLAVGAGGQAVYFEEGFTSASIGVPEDNPTPIPSRNLDFVVNADYGGSAGVELFPAAFLSVNYQHRIYTWLAASLAIEGIYSSAYPVKGDYLLKGDGQGLIGAFEKRYAHVGLRVGFAVNL